MLALLDRLMQKLLSPRRPEKKPPAYSAAQMQQILAGATPPQLSPSAAPGGKSLGWHLVSCARDMHNFTAAELGARELAELHGLPNGKARPPQVYYELVVLLSMNVLSREQVCELLELTAKASGCRICELRQAMITEVQRSKQRSLMQAAAREYTVGPKQAKGKS